MTLKATELINDLSRDPDILAAVKRIEAKIETTKNHYGDYMAFLSPYDKTCKQVIALAMIKAGGNFNGINWALKLGGGE